MREARQFGCVPEFEPRERPPKAPSLPFTGFAKLWYDTYVKPNNRPSQHVAKESSIRVHLAPFFGETDIRDIDGFAVDRLKAVLLQKGLSKTSVNRHIGILRTMLNLAVEWGMLPKAPRIRDYKLEQQERDFFRMDERDHFLAVCKEKRPEWHAFFVVAFHTGMRMGEMSALRWEDVDFFGRVIRVRRSNWRGHEATPKGRRARSVPMNSLVYETLKAHRHLGDHVFYNSMGKVLDINGGYRVFKTLCRLSELRALRRHDIRHSFASNLAAETGNLLAVKEILGHVDYSTTLRYAHLTPGQFADAVEKLVTKDCGDGAEHSSSRGRTE